MKSNAGMTLVEVLVALVIVFIIFLGLSDAGLVVLDQNIKNSQRDEAVSVAEMKMQEARDTAFDNLAVGVTTDNVFRQIRGLNMKYAVARTVTSIDTTNRQVTVNVVWNRNEYGKLKPYSHQIMTIVRQR